MQNLWKFILRYSNTLLFVLIEVLAVVWFFLSEHKPRSGMFGAANTVVATLNNGASGVSEYFSLRSTNDELAKENARLKEEIDRLKNLQEPLLERDSIYRYAHLGWHYKIAKVVDIQTNTQHNYLVLNKGERDSIAVGQGVIASAGVVGVVSEVNSHYSLVTPTIHPKMHVSCRIKKNGHTGFLQWNGPSTHYAYLTDVARHIPVEQGDTVVTSGLTHIFPEDIMVGVIDEVSLGEGDTYHTLRLRLSTDFSSLRYVQVVNNPLAGWQDSLIINAK